MVREIASSPRSTLLETLIAITQHAQFVNSKNNPCRVLVARCQMDLRQWPGGRYSVFFIFR